MLRGLAQRPVGVHAVEGGVCVLLEDLGATLHVLARDREPKRGASGVGVRPRRADHLGLDAVLRQPLTALVEHLEAALRNHFGRVPCLLCLGIVHGGRSSDSEGQPSRGRSVLVERVPFSDA